MAIVTPAPVRLSTFRQNKRGAAFCVPGSRAAVTGDGETSGVIYKLLPPPTLTLNHFPPNNRRKDKLISAQLGSLGCTAGARTAVGSFARLRSNSFTLAALYSTHKISPATLYRFVICIKNGERRMDGSIRADGGLKRTIQQTELVLVWFGVLLYSGVELCVLLPGRVHPRLAASCSPWRPPRGSRHCSALPSGER